MLVVFAIKKPTNTFTHKKTDIFGQKCHSQCFFEFDTGKVAQMVEEASCNRKVPSSIHG